MYKRVALVSPCLLSYMFGPNQPHLMATEKYMNTISSIPKIRVSWDVARCRLINESLVLPSSRKNRVK
jgi:hypothetical protein